MKCNVAMLEKIGQTMSIKQMDSVDHMMKNLNVEMHAFDLLKSKSKDLTCLLLPDDDDDGDSEE